MNRISFLVWQFIIDCEADFLFIVNIFFSNENIEWSESFKAFGIVYSFTLLINYSMKFVFHL